MKIKDMETHSAQETIQAGKEFAKKLKPGDVIALQGGLGSGKTTFIKGIALGLGLHEQDEVKSPTFVVMHVYPTQPVLYHFDLYRLESAADLEAIGFEEFIDDPHAITCVEWAERAADFIPRIHYDVSLKVSGEKSRDITIQAASAK